MLPNLLAARRPDCSPAATSPGPQRQGKPAAPPGMTLKGQPIRRRAAGSRHPREAHASAARLLRRGSRGPLAGPPASETPSFPFSAPFRLENMAGRVVPSVKPDTRLGGPSPHAARPRPSLQPLGPRGLRGREPRAGARASGAVPPPALPRLAAPA